MCITTFLHDSELNVPTSNIELNKVLKELRTASKEDWQLIERHHCVRGFFGRTKKSYNIYELYVFVGGCGPWQLINFYSEGSDTSINTSNSADKIMAFMLGYLGGIAKAQK
jgi:hypothetical protein